MQNVLRKFDDLLMSQQFAFLHYFMSGDGPREPEQEVVDLFEECKKLTDEEQQKVSNYVRSWAENLTREEMFAGARRERLERSSKRSKFCINDFFRGKNKK